MKFAATSEANVPFHSGCDDEEEACEIQAGIEEMQEKFIAFMDDKENEKSNAISKKNEKHASASSVAPPWE